jgi:tetratricopeptide (TPR) repeat protein
MTPFRIAVIALACTLVADAALAQRQNRAPPRRPAAIVTLADDDRTYRACMDRAVKEPADGFEDAMQWRDLGGGEAARHCVAIALLNLGRPVEAAERLEQLALSMRTRSDTLRARVLGQAGQAWLEAKDSERANAVLTAALELVPADVDLLVERSEALASAKNYWEAIDDLNRAIELNSRNAEAYALRSAAYRYVDSLDLAFEDANKAVELDKNLPEGFLERGILFRLQNKLPQARADWLQVLVLDGDGPTGDVARANIERLELKLDAQPANRPPGVRR